MALGLTQPLTELSTRNISWGGKGGRCIELTNLHLPKFRLSWNLGVSTSWNPQDLSRTLRGCFSFTSTFALKLLQPFQAAVRILWPVTSATNRKYKHLMLLYTSWIERLWGPPSFPPVLLSSSIKRPEWKSDPPPYTEPMLRINGYTPPPPNTPLCRVRDKH